MNKKSTGIGFLLWELQSALLSISDYHHFAQMNIHSQWREEQFPKSMERVSILRQQLDDVPLADLLAYMNKTEQRIAGLKQRVEDGGAMSLRVALLVLESNYHQVQQLISKQIAASSHTIEQADREPPQSQDQESKGIGQ